MSDRRRFPGLHLQPIDDTARDGRCRLVTDGAQFAAAAWRGGEWMFPLARRSIGFEPDSYQP